MASAGWQVIVEDSLWIRGRGVAVFGTLSGYPTERSFSAELVTPEGTTQLDEVQLEFVLKRGWAEQPALMLVGLPEGAAPAGSKVRPRASG